MVSQSETHPKIDSKTFVAVMWSGTAVSLSFLAFRVYVRVKSFRKIYADDVLALIAWLLLFASTVMLHLQQTAMYESYVLFTVIPTPEQLEVEKTFQRFLVAIHIIYYTSLWTVKLSFLVFFRRLGQNVRGGKMWWWCVTGLTVATWATCIGSFDYKCLLRSLEYISANCTSLSSRNTALTLIYYACAVDVITDAAIITVPIIMLWNVRITQKKKLALMSIFSLTIIVIIVSIVRVALVSLPDKIIDLSWLYMWSAIELAVSIVVSCLASFRQLYVKSTQSRLISKSANITSLWRRVLLTASKLSKTRSLSSCDEDLSTQKIHHHETAPMPDSTEHIIPLGTIYVNHSRSRTSNMDQP